MKTILRDIGLGDKEADIYIRLLNSPHQTAQQLADATGIKRTNVYRLLDSLQALNLVTATETGVKRFSVTEPQSLQQLLQTKQASLKQATSSLMATMPTIRAQYSLSLDRPGVVHMIGEDGLERLLLDMINSKTEVLLVAGEEPLDEAVLQKFRELIMQRKANGVATRALFHDGTHHDRIVNKFHDRGFDVRFLDSPEFPSEVIVYEDNVVFSVYDPAIITTIITNAQFAGTMRLMFDALWRTATS